VFRTSLGMMNIRMNVFIVWEFYLQEEN